MNHSPHPMPSRHLIAHYSCSYLVLKVLRMALGELVDSRTGDGVAGEGLENVELDTSIVGLNNLVSTCPILHRTTQVEDLTLYKLVPATPPLGLAVPEPSTLKLTHWGYAWAPLVWPAACRAMISWRTT